MKERVIVSFQAKLIAQTKQKQEEQDQADEILEDAEIDQGINCPILLAEIMKYFFIATHMAFRPRRKAE